MKNALLFICSTNILVRLLTVNMKNCLTPNNPKMCDPIVVTLLKMRPHNSQSSRENATPSSDTSPLASYKKWKKKCQKKKKEKERKKVWLPVSQWYVYSRTHITSDICIPYPPLLQTSADFISVVFLWILRIIIKGTTNDSRLWATYRQKGNDLRQNNRKKISLILCGPQCWCKYFFSFLSFCSTSNVIKYFTGRVK